MAMLFELPGFEGNYFVDSNYGPLLFDSGAGTSQLPDDAQTAFLLPGPSNIFSGAHGTHRQDTVHVPFLQAAGMSAEQLIVSLDAHLPLLGCDVLQHYAYRFDIPGREVYPIVPFRHGLQRILDAAHRLYVPFLLGTVQDLALLDTGAGISVLDAAFCRRALGLVTPSRSETCHDSSGAEFSADVITVSNLQIADSLFPPHEFLLDDFTHLNAVLPMRIDATIGTSNMACGIFDVNQRDGWLQIRI